MRSSLYVQIKYIQNAWLNDVIVILPWIDYINIISIINFCNCGSFDNDFVLPFYVNFSWHCQNYLFFIKQPKNLKLIILLKLFCGELL